jgi:hypothetical protein
MSMLGDPIFVLPDLLSTFSSLHVGGVEEIMGILPNSPSDLVYWVWALVLFLTTLGIGILSVLSGIEAGLLFVPVILILFPFHFDFVRACGIIVGLTGALAASPGFLKGNLTNLKLAFPIALIMSIFSISGAILGFILPEKILYIALGITILAACILLLTGKISEVPKVEKSDYLSRIFKFSGVLQDDVTGRHIEWKAHRAPFGLVVFIITAMVTGMFGISTGWGSIPALNLLMGIPLRISVATSKYLITVTHTSVLWIYINHGGIVPLLIIPSLAGTMLGAFLGIRILDYFNHVMVRRAAIIILALVGIIILIKG